MRKGLLRSETRLLLALFLFALLLRFVFIFVQTNYHPFNIRFYAEDSGIYDTLAQSLVVGEGYAQNGVPTANEPPGYPLFLAGTYVLFGRELFVVQILQVLLGAASVLLLFWIARSLSSTRVALVAAGIFAIYPHHLFWTGYLLTDTLYIFFSLTFLALCVQYQQQRSLVSLASAAIVLGFTVLTRATLLPFILLIVFWLYLLHRDTRKSGAMRIPWIPCSALFLLLFFLTLSPWIIHNAVQFHAFIPTDTKSTVALSEAFGPRSTGGTGGDSTFGIDYFAPELPQNATAVQEDQAYRALVWQGIRERPLWLLTSIPHKLWNMWRPNYAGASLRNNLLFDPPYLFAVIFGAVGMWMLRRQWRTYGLLQLYVLFHVIIHGVLYGIIRYRLPVEPVLLLFAAEAAWRTADRLGIHNGVLEGFLQHRRMARVLQHIPSNATMVDLGCGEDAIFLRTIAERIKKGIGFDLVQVHSANRKEPNLLFKKIRIGKRLPLPERCCTRVVSLAVFGCFDHPSDILRECHRILKPRGMLAFTIPLPPNRWLMKLLGNIGILDMNLVQPYKHFYTVAQLTDLLRVAGFHNIQIKKFQLGFNSLVTARR